MKFLKLPRAGKGTAARNIVIVYFGDVRNSSLNFVSVYWA